MSKRICVIAPPYPNEPGNRKTQPCMRRPPTVVKKFEPLGPCSPTDDARIAMKQNTSALHAVFHLHEDAVPSCSKLESTSDGSETPVSIISSLKTTHRSKNVVAGPSAKSCQTILYLKREIKPFSRLSAHFVYVFSVTHRCLSSSYHRPHGLSRACTQRSSYRSNERPHNGKDR